MTRLSDTCAAPGCDNPITRTGRPGRPQRYCSPTCRHATNKATATGHVVVEIDHEPMPDNTRPTGRVWTVQLRRADHTVIIATELGRPSADHLANQIRDLLNPPPTAHRAAID